MPDLSVDWLTPMVIYGPLGIFFAIGMYGVIWYAPQLIKEHLEFVKSANQTQTKIAAAMESLSDTTSAQQKECSRHSNALEHLANAGKEATTCPDVRQHLDKAIDAVRRDK